MFKLNQTQQIIIVFIIKIIVGTILLYWFGFNNKVYFNTTYFMASLFTTVSAVCVTGLSIITPHKDLNLFGQIVLLFLIQIGGLGFLTFSNWVILSIRGKIHTNALLVSQESLGYLKIIPIKFILKKVIIYTIVIEFIGALILSIRFWFDFPLYHALWLGIFHSISAFCNAGFSLFVNSLINYQYDPIVNFTISFLIILGGLGFIVLYDLEKWFFKHSTNNSKCLSLHTKVVLTYTGILILIGTLFFLVFEWNNSFLAQPFSIKFMKSLFLSITARTAGFNNIAISEMTNVSLMMLMFLMFIGASPGSTGGGIKTTTFAVLYTFLRSQLKNHPYPEVFYKTVPYLKVNKALGIVVMYFILFILSVIALQITELSHLSILQARTFFIDIVFEVFSALSTVGLSTGITVHLSDQGLCVLMICMFVGRLGPLAVISSMIHVKKKLNYSYPQGDIFIG